ncbi:hypothetical protein BTO09_10730 [Gilvibacter sp. SZ-19]|uniref:ABC transporter ATP-binding protein n=1 Tax=Gilvibacter sp. SZ-19 TaxID=754429 RepID=UPI000B3BE333|nr:polysaccharide ABC transporter ATP-binding protein [Gilvibacter sp. SZ-19]ARV12795.1 hypothetical protein BTO09_10730 [Gilvibacter sp. SZ-19]
MKETILKVEELSKQYRLGLVGTGSLVHDLNRFWHRIRGKEDPYLQIGSVNDRSSAATGDYVWALRDINFEVKKGEVLGIIGQNGAGKSTLLKLLSRVTSPTTGAIKSRGRIASLLEVGTGFHPELTGRENIYLNGAILGMTKAEIASKIDQIISFSGCEMYIDTPVKRYSSGMTVRLAFAVAAHLEPDILVVDEVLAVGDAEFQKKAIGKMQEISSGDGRTVLFVSHNMGSVKSLCNSVIVISNGVISFKGDVDQGIAFYLSENNLSGVKNVYLPQANEDKAISGVRLISAKITSFGQKDDAPIAMDHQILMCCLLEVDNPSRDVSCIFQFKDIDGKILFVSSSHWAESVDTLYQNSRAIIKLEGIIPGDFFNEGEFTVNVIVAENQNQTLFSRSDILIFNVNPKTKHLGSMMVKSKGPLKPSFKWHKSIIE